MQFSKPDYSTVGVSELSQPSEHREKNIENAFRSSNTKQSRRKARWKPNALRPGVLILAACICWALIITLQLLLVRSQRDGGLVIASKINALPLSQTFPYLYLPTILAVLYSIFWNWIDLEAKRLEPYYQMSKESGALWKDSLLLQYPVDFLPSVPVKTFRNR